MSKIVITFDKEQAVNVLMKAISVIPKKPLVPINEFYMFEVKGDVCLIYASDSTMTLRCSVNVTATVDECRFCIPAKLFTETIKLFHEPTFTITLMDKAAQLKSGKSKYKMQTEDAQYFSMIDEFNHKSDMSISGLDFREALSTTSSFVNPKVDNNLKCVHLSISNERAMFIAGQTSVLSKIKTKPHSLNSFEPVTIPYMIASVAKDLFLDKDIIDIYHDGHFAIFDNGNIRLLSILSDFKYPSTVNLFKHDNKSFFRVNTGYLLEAMKRIILYAPQGTYAVVFHVSTNNLMITAEGDVGNYFGEENLEMTSDREMTFGMPAHNIIHTLQSFMKKDGSGAEFIRMYMGDNPKMPMVITDDIDDNTKEFVVCPLMINKPVEA